MTFSAVGMEEGSGFRVGQAVPEHCMIQRVRHSLTYNYFAASSSCSGCCA